MDVDAFVAAHQAEWRRLDNLLLRRRKLTGAEVDELVELYQRAATHLSTIRSASPDPVLVGRLSTLVARSRAMVTGAHAPAWRDVSHFVLVSFPATAYRARWWWLGAAGGSLAVATLVGWWIAGDPQVLASLVPSTQVRQLCAHDFRNYYSQYSATSFAFRVWTNNLFIAAIAVVSGITLGLLPLYLLFVNALNGAVDGGAMFSCGRGAEFFALITPHGLLELSAVFLAAGVGMRMGWTIIDPGPRPRVRALAEEGRAAVSAALGLVGVLAVSGMIEAFVTPSPLPTWARIAIGVLAEVAFLSYVFVLGRRAVAAGDIGDVERPPDSAPVAA